MSCILEEKGLFKPIWLYLFYFLIVYDILLFVCQETPYSRLIVF